MSQIKDLFAKTSTKLHRAVFTATKGRVGSSFLGLPVVELTMTGAKTGKTRHTMVGAPIIEADRLVLVASYDGAPQDPAWYRNLCAHPAVSVNIKGKSKPMTARTASAAEKAELWPRIIAASKAYAKAQAKTSRDIPVVILTPASDAS
jgi:deazaflavin-dependent oxidoreductase (nitroreductase family)